jgi:signal peptidase I
MNPNKPEDQQVENKDTATQQTPSVVHHTPTHEEPLGQQKNPKERQQILRDILSVTLVLLSALVLAFCLISFVFQSYEVDGPSMQTTLHNNDHLIVWKVARTWARITHHAYIPKRGDIIVFNEPGLSAYGQSSDKQLIKRVIGLPGDRVVVNNGVITIYNKAHPKGFDPDKTLSYGKVIGITTGNIDITLGPNQIFVCGDNRSDSLDSRIFGPVDVNNIVGQLVLRVLPLSDAKRF